mgnify:CR=1 FL=1
MHSTTTHGRVRRGARRWAGLGRAAALAAALLIGALSAAAPAAALESALEAASPAANGAAAAALPSVVPAGKNLTDIVIDDTADAGLGILNDRKIRAGLEAIDFNEPTKVAIYTRDGLYEDNINTKTFLWAKQKRPDWISASDSDKWADGLLIITLSVEKDGHGQIGTYFGEDRKVGPSNEEGIQDAGKDNFRAADWTAGVLDVAQAAARKMNQPWYLSPGLWWPVGIGGGVAGIGAVVVSASRSTNRDRMAAGLESGTSSLTRVTMDLDNTELSARALPKTGSKHAADLEARFTSFMDRYRVLLTEQQELEATDKKQRGTSAVRDRAELFAVQAQDLDTVDDAISAAAALYARTAGWRDAWRLQIAPLEEDLAGIPGIIQTGQNMSFGFWGSAEREGTMSAASAALDAWLPTAQKELQDVSAQMEAGSIEVDAALDRLVALRAELTQRLRDYSSAQIDAFAKTDREAEEMHEQMDEAQSSSRRRSGSILDITSPTIFWSSVNYSTGYQSGVSSVESSRSSSSSSGGSTSGYSGGGGSFSGSGSSSRF